MPKLSKSAELEVEMDRRRNERRDEDTDSINCVEDDGADKPARRKTQRRRQIDPTTCERDYNHEEISFMKALDEYKRTSGRMFPTCSEILEVVRDLGYVKLTEEEKELICSIEEVEAEIAETIDDDFGVLEDDEILLSSDD